MLFPFRRKSTSLKIIFTISAAISSMVIQSGCLLLFAGNSSARALHLEQNNSVFLIFFIFKLFQNVVQKMS